MPQSSRRSGTSFLGYGPAGRRPCLQPRSCQPDTFGWQISGLPGCRSRPSACGRGFFCRTMTGGGTFCGLAPGGWRRGGGRSLQWQSVRLRRRLGP